MPQQNLCLVAIIALTQAMKDSKALARIERQLHSNAYKRRDKRAVYRNLGKSPRGERVSLSCDCGRCPHALVLPQRRKRKLEAYPIRLEHFSIWRNRKGFPFEANRDSSWGLVTEASPHGQTPLAGSSSSHHSGRGR